MEETVVKAEYWDVSDEQVVEKTGKPLKHWIKVLAGFKAETKKSTEAVEMLQKEHDVPRYWARTLTTRYLKSAD
jgi:Domain of unknown function (DUF4287)